jgi:fumarate hydratase, class II
MTGQEYRVERDSMGEVKVPKSAYYGAQTQRAVENFPISGIGFPPRFIPALAIIKQRPPWSTRSWDCWTRKSPT